MRNDRRLLEDICEAIRMVRTHTPGDRASFHSDPLCPMACRRTFLVKSIFCQSNQ